MFTFVHDPLASSFDQTLLQKIPFVNDINISTPSLSFENFQPYVENYDDPSSFLQDLLQHEQEHHVTLEEDGVSATKDHVLVNKMVEKRENRNDGLRNKRSCKKDRHSKIDTAHGPRDRRMRLSLEVARKFFGLQDMLKFDKASKTVDWLLNKSKSAIEEVEAARGHMISKKNSSSNSNNNNDGSNDDGNNNINNNNNSNSSVMMRSTAASSTTSECEVVSSKKMKRKKEKGSTRNSSTRKCRSHFSSSHSKIAKESRIKARERAKQRTREKFKMMTTTATTTMSRSNNYKDSHAENCGESGTQSGENSDNSMRNPSSLNHHHQVVEKLYCKDQVRANQEMGGNNDSASVGKWSPCPASSTFNCFSSEQHGQFIEFPLFSKLWEGDPNQFLC